MISNTILALDGERIYTRLSDPIARAVEQARYWGVETFVAMKMGNPESAYHRAGIAFRWAVQSGFYIREED